MSEPGIEIHYSNPQTTLRLQHAFAAGVEYVMREQQEPGQEVCAVDILAALRGCFMSLAHSEIIDKAAEPGKLVNAHVNKAAFLSVMDLIKQEINGWELPEVLDASIVDEPLSIVLTDKE